MNKIGSISWKVLNSKGFLIFALVLMTAVYGTKSDRYFGWTNTKSKDGQPVLSDGAGYYIYLPQWFIYHTDNFEFIDSITTKYPDSKFGINQIDRGNDDQVLNKYYTGTAVSNAPFFLIAHAQAALSGEDTDGYSQPYLMWMNVGSIAYFLFGCIGFYLFMRRFGIERFWILVGIYGMAYATNLSYYVNVLVPFAHVFSFAAVAWVLFFAKKWIDTDRSASFFWMCFFLGWAAIIRPTNVLVVVFIPFLFPSLRFFGTQLLTWLKNRKTALMLGMLAFFAFVLFQLFLTHAQSGEWRLNTYTDEGFDNWLQPEMWNVLFSWRKGLFIYAPVLFLMIPGLVLLFRKNRFLFWGFVFFFTLTTYVVSSWWCWWYGGGLGMRVFIDYLAILFIPIVLLLQYTKTVGRLLCLGFVVLTSWMYQVYEFQMRNNILHYDDMTYEQFSYVFMKEDLRFGWIFHLTYDTLPKKLSAQPIHESFYSYGKPLRPGVTEFKGDDLSDNPVVAFSLKKYGLDTLSSFFAAKLQANVRILTSETNPNFWILYFKGDSILKQSNIYMGPRILEVDQWTPMKFDLDPKLRCTDFDSVRIVFLEGNSITKAKNFNAQFYTYL